MDYKKEYKKLKMKIVDKFDYWLDNYIMIDISEAGEVDYLITEIDEYYFCLSLESELKFIIDDLISNDNKELLIQFIGLKRVLNYRIVKNKNYDKKDFFELYEIKSEMDKERFNYIKLNTNVIKSKLLINELFKKLVSQQFIECNATDFKNLFCESKNRVQIIWLKRQVDLLGLIFLLDRKNILSKNNWTKSQIAIFFFKNKKGDYRKRSLEVSSTKAMKEDDSYPEISKIVNSLIELN